jgi:hypothetical protein
VRRCRAFLLGPLLDPVLDFVLGPDLLLIAAAEEMTSHR